MRVSIVVPVLNEERNIPLLYEQVRRELETAGRDFELIFVDDGSTDGSVEAVVALNRTDPRVKLISFSRNFGHQIALTAGMDQSSGDVVIVMDADLQHPPAMIRELLDRWKEGFEVVHTVRETTQDAGWFKRTTGTLFYRLFRALSHIDLPANAADFRLLDRSVVRALGEIRERTRFLRGLTAWTGFRSTSIPYRAPARREGKSKFTPRRMARLAVDGLVSFSAIPLHVAIYAGVALAALGFLYSLYALYVHFFTGTTLPGWTSIIMLVAIVGGIQLILMGIIGVYLGKIYEETKQRPLYLVRRSIGFAPATVATGDRPADRR
jgi:glycosyltransferase involved in cell wall biosynthesis